MDIKDSLIFSSLADALVILDREGRVKEVNPQAEALCQLSKGDLLEGALELSVDLLFSQSLTQGEISFEFKGRRGVIEYSATLLPYDDEAHVLLQLRDVTQRKLDLRHDAQQRSIQQLEGLSHGLAFEINNPLQALLSNIRYIRERERSLAQLGLIGEGAVLPDPEDLTVMLRDFSESEFLVELPSILEDCLESLGEIRESVRIFSHLGDDRFQCLGVDLNKCIADAIRISRSSWERKIRLSTQLSTGKLHLAGRPGALTRMIINLLVAIGNSLERETKGMHLITVQSGQEQERIYFEVFSSSELFLHSLDSGDEALLEDAREVARQHGGSMRTGRVEGGYGVRVILPVGNEDQMVG